MKKSILILLVFGLVLILGLYGIALADGGAEGSSCNCDPWPEAKGAQQIKGNFTVAFNKVLAQYETYVYDFHTDLKKGNNVHLYSISLASEGKNICDYTATELKDLYKKLPCILDVGADFGMMGIPVITDLKINNKDFCGTKNGTYPPSYVEQDAMISGEVTIRFAPVTCPQ